MSQTPGSSSSGPESEFDPEWSLPQQREPNNLAVAGFIISLVGPCTLGLLSPIGALLSAFALRRTPRGYAIAGLTIGLLGCLLLAGAITFAIFNVRSFMDTTGLGLNQLATFSQTSGQLGRASVPIDEYHEQNDALPDDATGQQLIADKKDAWGTQLRYQKLDDTHYQLVSAGPDGEFDTDDDLPVRSTPGFLAPLAQPANADASPSGTESDTPATQPAATQPTNQPAPATQP